MKIRFTAKSRQEVFVSRRIQTASRTHLAPCPRDNRGCLPASKQPLRDTVHWPPFRMTGIAFPHGVQGSQWVVVLVPYVGFLSDPLAAEH